MPHMCTEGERQCSSIRKESESLVNLTCLGLQDLREADHFVSFIFLLDNKLPQWFLPEDTKSFRNYVTLALLGHREQTSECLALKPGFLQSLSFSETHLKLSVHLINRSEHHIQMCYMSPPIFKEVWKMLFHLLWYMVQGAGTFVHIEGYIPYDPDHRNPRLVADIVDPWNFMGFISSPLAPMCLTKTSKVPDTFRFSGPAVISVIFYRI